MKGVRSDNQSKPANPQGHNNLARCDAVTPQRWRRPSRWGILTDLSARPRTSPMRPFANGSRVPSNPQRRLYTARLDPDAFDVFATYQRIHGVSFNKAANAIARLAGLKSPDVGTKNDTGHEVGG